MATTADEFYFVPNARRSTSSMTKREAFAVAAMQGILARGTHTAGSSPAVLAVSYADALLAELAKDPA